MPLNDCQNDEVELAGTVDDFCAGGSSAIARARVTDLVSAQTATADRCGDFHLCLSPGATASLQIAASGYWTTDLENVTLSTSLHFPLAGGRGIPLLCSSYATSRLSSAAYFVPPGSAGSGAVLTTIASAGDPVCGAQGWTVVALVDGGAPSQNVAYLDAEQEPLPISPTASGCVCSHCGCTGAAQLALLYNLPAATDVQLAFTPPTGCAGPWDGGALTGAVGLVGNQLGYAVLQVP